MGGRYYQQTAVERVLEAVAAGQERILLTLATGTGKTVIAFHVAWKLFQARWNLQDAASDAPPARRPRILFLADRNILADQAFNAFSSFAAFPDDALVRINPADIAKGRVPKNGSIFFTIFQTFMSGTGPDGASQPYFGSICRTSSTSSSSTSATAAAPTTNPPGGPSSTTSPRHPTWNDGNAEAQRQR